MSDWITSKSCEVPGIFHSNMISETSLHSMFVTDIDLMMQATFPVGAKCNMKERNMNHAH